MEIPRQMMFVLCAATFSTYQGLLAQVCLSPLLAIADSVLVWEIPHCWWPRSEDGILMYNGFVPSDGEVEFAKDCRQISTLNEYGTVTLKKHNCVIMRTTNDWIRLDGVTVHGGE